MEIKNNVFVVTGAGNGIGRAISLAILNKGGYVAGCDIDLDGLNQTKSLAGEVGQNMSVFKLDITDTESIKKLPELVVKEHGKVDGLINVAGIIQPFVKFMSLNIEKIEQVFNVNFYGAMHLIRAFLPIFLGNKTKASIVNIGSMAGFIPVPGQTIYGASKGALKMLSEGLYSELKNTNVTVSLVSPGGVATSITQNSGVEMSGEEGGKKKKQYKMITPEQAADVVLNAIKKERFKVTAGKDARTMDLLYRLNPLRATNLLEKNMRGILKD